MRFKKTLVFREKQPALKTLSLKVLVSGIFCSMNEGGRVEKCFAGLPSLKSHPRVKSTSGKIFCLCKNLIFFFQPKTISNFLLFLIQYLSKPPKTRWKCWLLSSAYQATSSSRSDSKPNFDVKLILWPDQ